MQENTRNNTTIKILYTAGSILLTIITIVVTISFFLAGMKQDVALIKQDIITTKDKIDEIKDNHLHELKDGINANSDCIEDLKDELGNINENLIHILTLMGKY